MIELSDKTVASSNIYAANAVATFDATPENPTFHKVFVNVKFTDNDQGDSSRNMNVRVYSNVSTYIDTNMFFETTGDAGEPSYFALGPFVVGGDETVVVNIESSDNTEDIDIGIRAWLLSDDVQYFMDYRAAETTPTANSHTQRIRAIDDLTQASGAGDLAAILTDTDELQGNQADWATATSVTVSDKTGFSLVSTGLDAVTAWTVNITGTMSGNSTHSAANVVTALDTGSTLTACATATTTTLANLEVDVTKWKGAAAPAMTGDAYARLGAPAGASVSADIAAVKAETALIVADTGTDGVLVAAAAKTGYKLASDGLDSVAITYPSGVASNFREMMIQLWIRFFGKVTKTDSAIRTYAANGTDVLTTQVISDTAGTETQGAAS